MPPITLSEHIMEAIRSVTDKPVTHVVYSHWHADHIGVTPVYGENVEIIAHEKTKELLTRFPDENRPLPTITFDKEYKLSVGGLDIELRYYGQSHSEGLIFSYLPKEKVLMAVDIASPGWVTFRDADASENFNGYVEAFDKILDYDFDIVISGHVSTYGNREDVEEGKEYMKDLEKYAKIALETVDMEYFTKQLEGTPYKVAFRFAEENYFQAATNYGTKLMLEAPTSNGKLWAERLNGVEAFTAHNMFAMIEHTRLEKPHGGYMTQKGKPFPKWYA
ncbi:MBL fold metallo-hydrolase [Rothia aerolata]|nr:MBL fold metallo-hydrolase [Rothia aerolata]